MKKTFISKGGKQEQALVLIYSLLNSGDKICYYVLENIFYLIILILNAMSTS